MYGLFYSSMVYFIIPCVFILSFDAFDEELQCQMSNECYVFSFILIKEKT